MSIRLLALDLYQSQKEVDRIEKDLRAAHWEAKPGLEDALRRACAQRDRLRRLLDSRIAAGRGA